jgi:hypothetical protein
VRFNLNEGVDVKHALACGLELGSADVFLTVQDLTLQVGLIDDVEIDDADRTDAGRAQVQTEWRAEAAGAHHEHARRAQLALSFEADLRHDEVPAVPADLILRQLRRFRRNASGDARHERDRVARIQLRRRAVERTHIVFVDVRVDEVAQLPALVVQMRPQLRITFHQMRERVTDRGRGDLDFGCATGVTAQRRRNPNRDAQLASFA